MESGREPDCFSNPVFEDLGSRSPISYTSNSNFNSFSLNEDIVHLSSIFTFLNSDAYLSGVQVIRYAFT